MKCLRIQIEIEAASPSELDDVDSRDLFRAAGEKGLIANIEAWLAYHKPRIEPRSDYKVEASGKALQTITGVLGDACLLLHKLEERN